MSPWTDKHLDTPLAELELCGLSRRTCNMLETSYQAIYVRDLIGTEPETLASIPYFGEEHIQEIQEALKNFRNGLQTKTIEECLEDNDE